MPSAATSSGTAPRACTASTQISAPWRCASSAMARSGMARPVWNCTALTATSRAPRSSSAARAWSPSWSLRSKASSGSSESSRPKRAAARCQGVTLAGNSPRKPMIRSPARQGKHSATAAMPAPVFGVTPRSSGRAPMSRPSPCFRRARRSSAAPMAAAPRRAKSRRPAPAASATSRDGGETPAWFRYAKGSSSGNSERSPSRASMARTPAPSTRPQAAGRLLSTLPPVSATGRAPSTLPRPARRKAPGRGRLARRREPRRAKRQRPRPQELAALGEHELLEGLGRGREPLLPPLDRVPAPHHRQPLRGHQRQLLGRQFQVDGVLRDEGQPQAGHDRLLDGLVAAHLHADPDRDVVLLEKAPHGGACARAVLPHQEGLAGELREKHPPPP